ncbi:MAG: hypothetical protein ACC726_06080, partial [Chloroflexota bacterium]
LLAMHYGGWLVVEQDRAPLRHQPIEAAAATQEANLRWLSSTLERLGEAAVGSAAIGGGA